MAERGEEIVLRLVRALRRLAGLEQFVFEVPALPHPDENAGIFRDAIFFKPPRVDQEGHLFAGPGPQSDIDFFYFSLEFQERKKVGLVEHPAAGSEEDLDVLPGELA